MTANFSSLRRHDRPFAHWIGDGFLPPELVREINREWPADGWRVESGGGVATKASVLFPRRLPAACQRLAEALNGPEALDTMSDFVGVALRPDPWLHEGPVVPRLGGGLHEIRPGGWLGIHVDFEQHPSGLRRVANLLVYLNEGWRPEWGGDLELHDDAGAVSSISPIGGRAVLFRTTADSWHGHPSPLACPPGVTRRSLALYYYAEGDAGEWQRPKTVYRRKGGV